MRRSLGALVWLAGVLTLLVYGLAQQRLSGLARDRTEPELLISLPRFAQVLMAGGDRYLAANLAGFRVLVADTGRMAPADYAVQAKLQRDIAWFNPMHADNYYIAAAILPWNGQFDSAQSSWAGLPRRGLSTGIRSFTTVFSFTISAAIRRPERIGCWFPGGSGP